MMDELRNWLLENQKIRLYELLVSFMRMPDRIDIDEIINNTPDEALEMVNSEVNNISQIYATDREKYMQRYFYGQVIIWEEVLKTYQTITRQLKIIEKIELVADIENYASAVVELQSILIPYANMQIALTDLEKALGVDRFLDRVSEGTFSILKSLLTNAKRIVEEKTAPFKLRFQVEFDNTNVSKVVLHSLLQRNDKNQICDLISSGNKQVILIVIDGFGYCQYLWNRGLESGYTQYTFKENLFEWMKTNNLLKECILGSGFVSDTSSGLSQIFLGQKAKETKIVASKLRKRSSVPPFLETKNLNKNQFENMFRCGNSITDVVATCIGTPSVMFCSRLPEASGFCESIYKSAELLQVLPPERVFSILLEQIVDGKKDGLQVIYMTNIDNSGHTMGAYSGFERQEHEKIDYLLRSFLIELAVQCEDLFDDTRSILITADHGMFESSSIMVSRQDILDFLSLQGTHGVRLIENNRALLVYNEGDCSKKEIVRQLRMYFLVKGLDVDIQTDTDEGFAECLGVDSSDVLLPDIVIRLVSEGLFYSNKHVNKHLLHFGGHGGYSVDEVFVPLLEIPLSKRLLRSLNDRFLSRR